MKMSIKTILSLLFSTFIIVGVTAQTYGPQGPITEITFENTEFDFGKIQEREVVKHVFTFTNTGDEPLILSNVKGSCGCTVPAWPREPLMPGETSSITVEFNSKGKKGSRNQKVTITANTDPPQSFIYMKGEVTVDDEKEYQRKLETDPETELASMDCVAVFPNPTSDILKLDLKDNYGKTALIGIYSKSGQLMAQRKVIVEGIIDFEVGHYPSGAYVAKVQMPGVKPIAKCFVVKN